jgi:hypothetical protein
MVAGGVAMLDRCDGIALRAAPGRRASSIVMRAIHLRFREPARVSRRCGAAATLLSEKVPRPREVLCTR